MIFEHTLSNGLEVVIQPTSAPIAAMQVWVDVGSLDEKPQEAGFCHFLEHMLFKGTEQRTTKEIASSIEGLGGEMNAFTSFEYTVYHMTISHDRWHVVNEVLADMLLASTFKPTEFDPEKEVILEEIKRSEDSPERQLYLGAYTQVYGNSGYGRPVIGTPKTVQACSSKGLRDFWRKWYSPSLMTVVLCGNIDPQLAMKGISRLWGKATTHSLRPRRRTLASQHLSQLARADQRARARNFPVNAIRWVGSLPGCSVRDPGLAALDLSSMVLGQGEASRLHQRLFRQEKLVTTVASGVWAPHGMGMYTFDVEAPLEKAGLFRKSLNEEIEKFCSEGPTKDELDRAKVVIESERVYGMQSMDALANRIGFLKTVLGNVHFDLEYAASARELTSDAIRETAQQFLANDMREFVLLPSEYKASSFWKQPSAVAKKHEKRSSKKLAAVTPTTCEKISLANGVELVLFPRNDLPIVSVHAAFLGGTRIEPESKAGIGSLMSDVWEKGPQGWTTVKFAEYLESKAARIDAFSGRNSTGLSATFLTRTLDDVLPLFVDTLANPSFLQEELDNAKSVALEEIRTSDDHLDRMAMKLLYANLFENHPYSYPVVGLADTVARFSVDDLQTHFKSIVASQRPIVAISGHFNRKQLISIFENFKRNSAIQRGQEKLPPPVSLLSRRLVQVQKNREQSHLVVGFLGTTVRDQSRFDLRVLLTILGGQSGRLFVEIRDKQGLCYTVSPVFFEGLETGFVGAYIACDPVKRNQALDAIFYELQNLIEKPVGRHELNKAKEFVLGRHFMEMQLNSSVAAMSAFNTLFGLGHDEHLKLQQELKKVTPQSIQSLARRLFGSPAVTVIVA